MVVSQAFQPMLLKSYAAGDQPGPSAGAGLFHEDIRHVFQLGFAGFMALGQAYYKLWMPGQDSWLLYTLTALTIATVVPGGPMQPLYYIYTLTVKKENPLPDNHSGRAFERGGHVRPDPVHGHGDLRGGGDHCGG